MLNVVTAISVFIKRTRSVVMDVTFDSISNAQSLQRKNPKLSQFNKIKNGTVQLVQFVKSVIKL